MNAVVAYFLFPLAALGLMISVHELFHFLVARRSGVLVTHFCIGFGPKVLRRKIGETEYALAAVPLGGYVRMLGEDPKEEVPEELRHRSLAALPYARKMGVVLAGPAGNVVLAVALLFVVNAVGYDRVRAVVGAVTPGSPAQDAGVLSGDEVVAVKGTRVSTWTEMAQIISATPAGEPVSLLVRRNGSFLTLRPAPRLSDAPARPGLPRRATIGVAARGDKVRIQSPIHLALGDALQDAGKMTVLLFRAVHGLVSGSIPLDTVGGPATIFKVTGDVATSAGPSALLYFVAFISMNLAVMNLLPIPVLDGGHALVWTAERLRGRNFDPVTRARIQIAGLAILSLIFAVALFNDMTFLFGK